MKTQRKLKIEIAPDCVNGVHVWVVYKGGAVKYAWPRDGKSSREVANEIAANWK
jgi:hypothetical protein